MRGYSWCPRCGGMEPGGHYCRTRGQRALGLALALALGLAFSLAMLGAWLLGQHIR